MENNNHTNSNDDNINYYNQGYRIDNNNNYRSSVHDPHPHSHPHPHPDPDPDPDSQHESMNSQVIPLAMHSNILRMLYELRVPLYALGGGASAAGGAGDDMEREAAEVLALSLYDARPIKHVIDVADGESGEKHGIREMIYDQKTAEEMKINTACGIWQEEFEEGEQIKVLPCNHAFRPDAITKWLMEEKAECPICRFKLASKEVIVHHMEEMREYGDERGRNYYYNDDNDDDNDDDDSDDVDASSQPQPQQPQSQPPVNEQRARENNIMNRQNNRIHNPAHAGGASDMGRDAYYDISMPMNRLLQIRSGLINGDRFGAGAAPARAVLYPLPSQVSQPPPIVTNINNYYINNRVEQYRNSAEEQEEADIEEAIRRSLSLQ